MTLPSFIPLILIILFVGSTAIVSGFQLYHVYSFGVWDKKNIGAAFVFLLFLVALTFFLLSIFASTDWSQPLSDFTLPTLPTFDAQ